LLPLAGPLIQVKLVAGRAWRTDSVLLVALWVSTSADGWH